MKMKEPLVVEVWGKPVGVVVKKGDVFRFHAIAQHFSVLETINFTTLGHAKLAAAQLQSGRWRERVLAAAD